MIADSIAIDEALLALKIGFIVLLYLFIWRIVRSASRDFRGAPGQAPIGQESMIVAPGQAAGLGLSAARARLVVLKSPALSRGEEIPVESTPITVGRGGQNDVALDGDDYASAKHARIEPRGDGVWVEDVGSTNGTYLNGIKLTRARKLTPGDVVRVGETELRYET